MEYLPFGETLVDEHLNSYNSPFKYNGKEYDAETGNYYYGARYYDPKWSIFISVDPLAEKYPSWGSYHYVHQNPINLIDPTGMSAVDNDDWYMNETTGAYEWHDGSAEKKGYTNLTKDTNGREAITGATGDGKNTFSLNPDATFSSNGKAYDRGEIATWSNGTKIESNLNLKEKNLKVLSDAADPIFETPQDILFPIINQVNVFINEGVHEGAAYNSNNYLLPNTYELNNWKVESGRSNTSTGNMTFQEGQEIMNNTTSVIALPVKAANNPATNFIIKTVVKTAIKKGLKAIE